MPRCSGIYSYLAHSQPVTVKAGDVIPGFLAPPIDGRNFTSLTAGVFSTPTYCDGAGFTGPTSYAYSAFDGSENATGFVAEFDGEYVILGFLQSESGSNLTFSDAQLTTLFATSVPQSSSLVDTGMIDDLSVFFLTFLLPGIILLALIVLAAKRLIVSGRKTVTN